MKAVIQRVKSAQVMVDGKVVSQIEQGILTFLGIAQGDDEIRLTKLIHKICDLRIFENSEGKMNHSLKEIHGAHLIVSQFTLLGDCTQGRRPSFIQAEKPDVAKRLYERALQSSQEQGVPTQGGVFQANMEVVLKNDGPCTLILEA